MKKKFYITILIAATLLSLMACKKKRVWREVGNDLEATREVQFGVQYKNGTPSEVEESIPLVVIYLPLGDGSYEKALYEVDKITPESITDGLKYYGVLDTNTTFARYEEFDAEEDEKQLVGPGEMFPGEKKTKKGEITLKDFTAGQLINEDGKDVGEIYEELHPEDEFGSMSVYLDAATETYTENLGLTNCDILFE